MADLSHWFAQACEYHDSEGTFKVIYFQDRQELMVVVEELLRNGDSWSDGLFGSNSNLYKSQVTMPSPDTGSLDPTERFSSVNAPNPVSIMAGDNDLKRFFSKEFFEDLPGAVPKNDISNASITLDQDVVVYEGGNNHLPSQTIATNSSKNDALVQEAKKKEEIKYKKSIEQPGILPRIINRVLSKLFTKDPQVHPLQDYKIQDQNQHEGGSSLPREMTDNLDELDDNPFKSAKPPGYCKYAILFGITTKFNPSGVWVIEELYNDMQNLDF